MAKRFILGTIVFMILVGCSTEESSPTSTIDDRVSPDYSGPAEISYCDLADVVVYAPAYTISGTATYQARTISGGELGSAGAAQPIRYAEVRITDSSDAIVQCAETDVNGDFSFDLPQSGSTYTISVNARADNNSVKISVLNKPEENEVYALTTSVTSDATKSVGTINAGVTGNILGAAFNIYDQILEANEFLRSEVGTCSVSGCANFTVAPKVEAYWEKGFTPATYLGYSNTPLSYYYPSVDRLFILGGINGDTDSSDTDHFDNSIILHEYGHFLEDVMSKSDSFGGSHSGTEPIDPRLAWSEGFANFFQAAVLNAAEYVDTSGNTDGSTTVPYIDVDLESNSGCTNLSAGCDKTNVAGEGNFREFAISRFLWDAHDAVNASDETSGGGAANDNVSGKFENIWAAFVKTDGGINDSDAAYRSVGLLNHSIDQVIGDTSLSGSGNIMDHHRMVFSAPFRAEFANYVDNTGGCGKVFNMDPSSDFSQHINSDFLLNNDFFHYKHPGGTLNLTLKYTTNSGTEADLDLYIYDDADSLLSRSSDDFLSRSQNQPDGTISDEETESLTISSLSAGDYLINVYAYDAENAHGDTDFELEVGGTDLCVATPP